MNNKKIYVVNTGDSDEAVRITYTEKWVAEDGTILSSPFYNDGRFH